MPPKKTIARTMTTECLRCYMFKKEIQRLERTIKRLRLLLPIKIEKESIACQTEEEEDHQKEKWTETGTLIDEDEEEEEETIVERIDSTAICHGEQ